MKDNLLFAYHDTSVIQEFNDMMKQYDFEYDTVENGLDAVELLKKQEYKVVITGIDLAYFNGLKIIEYLNKRHPNTVCIVYTSRMDLGRLKFLVNHRDIFRIFLWPANYHGDFYESILEGFEYYNLRCATQEEKSRNQKRHEDYRRAVNELKKLTGHKQENVRIMGLFLLPVIRMSVNRFSEQLDQLQREQVVKYEEAIFSYYLRESYHPCENLEDMKRFLKEEFSSAEEERELMFKLQKCQGQPEPVFFEDARFLAWLLLKRYTTFSKTYMSIIEVSFPTPKMAELCVTITLPKGTMARHDAQPLSIIFTRLTQEIAREIATELDITMDADKIIYRFQLAMDKKLNFMEEELELLS